MAFNWPENAPYGSRLMHNYLRELVSIWNSTGRLRKDNGSIRGWASVSEAAEPLGQTIVIFATSSDEKSFIEQFELWRIVIESGRADNALFLRNSFPRDRVSVFLEKWENLKEILADQSRMISSNKEQNPYSSSFIQSYSFVRFNNDLNEARKRLTDQR